MSEQSLRLFMLGIFWGNMEHSKFMMEIMFDSGKIGPVLCRLIILMLSFQDGKKIEFQVCASKHSEFIT